MTITPGDLGAMIADLQAAALASEQRLNAADAKLGDGDTGSMLLRILNAMNGANVAGASDLSAAAKALAQAAMKETGSSLGTLAITALMSLAKQAQDGALEPRDMGTVVAGMRDAVAARGKAEDGDKTVVDSLTAIARALDEGPATRDTAARAAWAALDEFRERPCRIGRARMFPERSKAADDPGMLAVALLLDNKETAR